MAIKKITIETQINVEIIEHDQFTWGNKKKILVILAHPDDPEFFCGGTLHKWTEAGNVVEYCLLTQGEKGINSRYQDLAGIIQKRQNEQIKAAKILGVQEVTFLDYEDGILEPNLDLRQDIVRVIRQRKPDIVVSCDPDATFLRRGTINHPDHRAAGMSVVNAIFPAAQNAGFYPDLVKEGLHPHHVEELWLSLTNDPNMIMDVTTQWEKKISAILAHRSQIVDEDEFVQKMMDRKEILGQQEGYFEKFKRIMIRK